MNNPLIYRNRIIPNESTYLKDDKILKVTEDIIITKWNVLKPRNDFSKGISVYFLKEGYKISKFMDSDNNLVYYYCDIIETQYKIETNEYYFLDLLVDVIIYEDGFIKVIDIKELYTALDENLISIEILKTTLLNLDKLLKFLYSGGLKKVIFDYFEVDCG